MGQAVKEDVNMEQDNMRQLDVEEVEKKEGKVVSFSTFVEVKEDDQIMKVNEHLMDMVLLVSQKDKGFKERLLSALEEL